MKAVIKNYSRESAKTKSVKSKTVNLTIENAKKVEKLNIFLSKLVRDYLDKMTKKELCRFSKDSIPRMVNAESERITTSITLRVDQIDVVKELNITALVNHIVEEI